MVYNMTAHKSSFSIDSIHLVGIYTYSVKFVIPEYFEMNAECGIHGSNAEIFRRMRKGWQVWDSYLWFKGIVRIALLTSFIIFVR